MTTIAEMRALAREVIDEVSHGLQPCKYCEAGRAILSLLEVAEAARALVERMDGAKPEPHTHVYVGWEIAGEALRAALADLEKEDPRG